MATTATKFALLAGLVAVETATASRLTVGFNDGWEFSRDKAEWREVDVPHDWAIEGPFDPEGDAHTGKLPYKGVGYYRKRLVLDASPKGRRVFLDFDGVMASPEV